MSIKKNPLFEEDVDGLITLQNNYKNKILKSKSHFIYRAHAYFILQLDYHNLLFPLKTEELIVNTSCSTGRIWRVITQTFLSVKSTQSNSQQTSY